MKHIHAILPTFHTGHNYNSELFRDISKRLKNFINRFDISALYYYQPIISGPFIVVSFNSEISDEQLDKAQKRLNRIVDNFVKYNDKYYSFNHFSESRERNINDQHVTFMLSQYLNSRI